VGPDQISPRRTAPDLVTTRSAMAALVDGGQIHRRCATPDLKWAALLLTTDHRLIGRAFTPTGQVEFIFADVPAALLDDLANDRLKVSAKRLLESLETIHLVVAQSRRDRDRPPGMK